MSGYDEYLPSEDPQIQQSQTREFPAAYDPNQKEFIEARREHRKHPSRTWLAVRELFMVVVVAIIISALIKAFLIQAFIIPSESMENTLLVNDRVLVSKLVPDVRQLNRGDIIVFEDTDNWLNKPPTSSSFGFKRILVTLGLRPDDSENHLIKRVIGLPGDHVQCCDAKGRLVVNGVSITEPYLKPGVKPSEIPFDVHVPPHKLWVMGDNRANSGDSRYHMEDPSHGFVKIKSVTGRAFVIMWPFSRWQTLSNSNAFAAVPAHEKK